MPADRPGGYAGVGAQFELAGEQVLHAILVHDQHDQINRLAADLQSEASTFDSEECRSAPPFRRTATGWSAPDRKSTRLNSSHSQISYAVFCLKKKKNESRRDRSAEGTRKRTIPRPPLLPPTRATAWNSPAIRDPTPSTRPTFIPRTTVVTLCS